MYEKSIKLLKMSEVELEVGLTVEEITKIEDIYKIRFPKSLREFLMAALPISDGFYNWRNIDPDNIKFIKKIIGKPIKDIYELANDVYWCDDWGKEPNDEVDFVRIVRAKLQNAPKLLPIYEHRYMPMLLIDDPPVISVHDTDIIYYGKNLEDYFKNEFGMKRLTNIKNISYVKFWTDIM